MRAGAPRSRLGARTLLRSHELGPRRERGLREGRRAPRPKGPARCAATASSARPKSATTASPGCTDCLASPGYARARTTTQASVPCGDSIEGDGATCDNPRREAECDMTGYWISRETDFHARRRAERECRPRARGSSIAFSQSGSTVPGRGGDPLRHPRHRQLRHRRLHRGFAARVVRCTRTTRRRTASTARGAAPRSAKATAVDSRSIAGMACAAEHPISCRTTSAPTIASLRCPSSRACPIR